MIRPLTFVFVLLLALNSVSYAQNNKQIRIETKNISLVFSVKNNQRLYQTYFGKKLEDAAENNLLPGSSHEAYITGGMEDLFQPAIRMVHTDGNPSLELEYVNYKTEKQDNNVTVTSVALKDPKYPVEVTLYFAAYFNEDIIKEWTGIRHQEKKPVTLTDYASSMLHFDADKYFLTHFHNDWAKEMQMEENELGSGIKILDSKLGTRADMYQPPVFFLSLNKPSDENNGEVIAGTLAWTGNFRFLFEVDQRNSLRLISGINPYASEYKLEPNQAFVTPAFIFTYSEHGKGEASRNLHTWARNYGILDGNKPRLTLLNNWEATRTDFNEKELVSLFDDANKLGVDLFLLDDGWFGNKYPRNNDKAGLGDWQEDTTKLPSGIGYLVKEAAKKGIKFGIWLEPEMVNPKSELYEKHPDWILRLPNRAEHYQRNQLALDLTNPKVQDFVFKTVDDLLSKNPGLAYIKWDANRNLTNTWSPYLKEDQSNLYVDFTKGLYKVFERVRAKYPHLPIMLCSGGGGRTDYGALKYFTEFWPSDNTDGLERIYIQWGYSYFFPSLAISAHITSWGKESLKFRTDVAMMGKMGYDIKVDKMTPDELQFSNQAVKTYKRLNNVIWFGDQYRLVSPYEANRAVLMYVNKEKSKSVLFAYNMSTRYKEIFNRIKLQGLDPDKKYKVEEINLFPGTKSINPDNGKVLSGNYLMTIGLNLSPGKLVPLTSYVFEITAQ